MASTTSDGMSSGKSPNCPFAGVSSGVSANPGQTALTVMFSAASVGAAART